MKKTITLTLTIFMVLSLLSSAGEVEKGLRKKGLHVADLTDADKINIEINKLQQVIQQQRVGEIENLLSTNYAESDPTVTKSSIGRKLEECFTNLAGIKGMVTQTDSMTGWRATSTQDFYIQNIKIITQGDKARAECEMGFYSNRKDNKNMKEVLSFVLKEHAWFLDGSDNLFGFLIHVSKAAKQEIRTNTLPGGIMSGSKDDFTSTQMLVPVTLFVYNGTPVPRFNITESFRLFSYYEPFHGWRWINIMSNPYGVLADVLVTPGGNEPLNHEFLFISDAGADKIVGTQMGSWIAEYGTAGSGQGQFQEPHGISCLSNAEFFVTDMRNNRVVAYHFENSWSDPIWEFDLQAGFNHPVDVEVKEWKPSEPPQDETRIVVADEYNHRLAFFLWFPYPICFHRYYGEYGSGEGQFILPNAVCFGRDPQTGWQTDDVFVTDYGNHRLVRLYITFDDVYWRGSYQFPSNVDLTSVEVDNQGLVYVVDRRNGKVYKLAPSQGGSPYYFTLLGIWGESGTGDGQLFMPNTLTIAHGSYCPYPEPCYPMTNLGDVFVTESWGELTGVRRFVIAADVLNFTAGWVPYNESTGEGNYIWYQYHLTDFGTVTEKVMHSADVCTTYNRGSLTWGSQGGAWPVDGHPHGTNYTVKIRATSIYDPAIVVEKSVDVYVDTLSTHNPVITQDIRCQHDNPIQWCDNCWQCLKEHYPYTVYVQAFDPDNDSLSYEWRCARGDFYYDGYFYKQVTTSENCICYYPPPPPVVGQKGQDYEWIYVNIANPYGGESFDKVVMDSYLFHSDYSCPCGDVNYSGQVELGDIVYLISYLYKGGPLPPNPIERADVNNSCAVELGDVVYLLNYLYKNGPRPKCCWIH
jgi:hypothetical protein